MARHGLSMIQEYSELAIWRNPEQCVLELKNSPFFSSFFFKQKLYTALEV